MKKQRFVCPACSSALRWTGSHIQHPQLRRSNVQCTNVQCSSTWVVMTEITENIAPPAEPFTNPLRSRNRINNMHELALNFIEQNNGDCKPQDCVEYLMDKARSDYDTAVLATEQAFISHFDDGSGVRIDVSKSNRQSVVVSVDDKDCVIPAKDLLALINKEADVC